VKIDSAGNQLWSQAYGSPEEDKAFSVIETQDGSYLIAGLTWGFRPWGDFSMYLIKTDSLGNLIWSMIYNASTQILTDAIREVIQLTDGNYAFAGYSSPALMLASITKTDTSGNPIWSMNYGSQHDIGVGLQETKDGGFAMIGYGYEGLVGYDLFFVKTDSIGNSSCNQYVNNLITSAPATQTEVAHITSGYAPVSISNLQVTTSKGITGVDPCIFSNVASADATDEINIYPNPASWMITVSIPAELKDVSIELYNIFGEQLQKILPHQTFEVTLDVSGFASGLYFIKITGNNSAQWKRLLIE
jgi:hypothetical protein